MPYGQDTSLTPPSLIRGFGHGVRQLREARGWSQEQLAEQAGLNRSFVGEIERGEVTVSLSTVAKLSRAFELTPSTLVKRGETNGVASVSTDSRLVAIGG
jgi:transcriptional regulator with XRE-family HTH domain